MDNQVAQNSKVVIVSGMYKGKSGYVDRIDQHGYWVRGEVRALFPYRGPVQKNQIAPATNN